MSEIYIYFQGVQYLRADLSEPIINYIETYNSVASQVSRRGPDDRDYEFRMTQARQMFGDTAVIAGIQLLIAADLANN